MPAKVSSFLLQGIAPQLCEIEVDINTCEETRTQIVGLPDAAVRESAQRVRSAIQNSGYAVPEGLTLVSLAPADLRKEGPVYDLPIAVGVLRATGVLPESSHDGWLLAGELALDGRLRPIRGAVNLALLARDSQAKGVILPEANADEASLVSGVTIFACAEPRSGGGAFECGAAADASSAVGSGTTSGNSGA